VVHPGHWYPHGVAPFPEILYRDESVIAVHKPSGWLVHRGWARDGEILVDHVRAITGQRTVHPIHRLDRGTSGVVLFALDPASARTLAAAFERGDVHKRYLALVRGCPPEEGLIDHPIRKGKSHDRVDAVTAYRRLATVDAEPRTLSLVEVLPRTGRLHQIRRHLKHLGHPVIGDSNYGRTELNRAIAERYGLRRLALHAWSLELPHPATGEPLHLETPPPLDLTGPLARIGLLSSWGTTASRTR
jgi:tRNA pseudouridine65 synthase